MTTRSTPAPTRKIADQLFELAERLSDTEREPGVRDPEHPRWAPKAAGGAGRVRPDPSEPGLKNL